MADQLGKDVLAKILETLSHEAFPIPPVRAAQLGEQFWPDFKAKAPENQRPS